MTYNELERMKRRAEKRINRDSVIVSSCDQMIQNYNNKILEKYSLENQYRNFDDYSGTNAFLEFMENLASTLLRFLFFTTLILGSCWYLIKIT